MIVKMGWLGLMGGRGHVGARRRLEMFLMGRLRLQHVLRLIVDMMIILRRIDLGVQWNMVGTNTLMRDTLKRLMCLPSGTHRWA